MSRPEGFTIMGARLGYWIAGGIAGFIGAVALLGKIAEAMGGAA